MQEVKINKKLLTTKEFAVLCKTTKRTIIHYDQIGLLKPYMREETRRLYTTQQVIVFEKIALVVRQLHFLQMV